MKKLTLFLAAIMMAMLSFAAQPKRIYAYGLSASFAENVYTFSFHANETPTAGKLVFYDATSSEKVGETALENLVLGKNEITIAAHQLPGDNGQQLNWAIELSAAAVTAYEKVFADASHRYRRGYSNVDVSPESDYFGSVYVADRTSTKSLSKFYVYSPDYQNADANGYTLGASDWAFGRFAIAPDGKVWLSDYSDGHSGLFIVDPADLTKTTQFFAGTRASSGLIKNGNVEVGSSLSCATLYGKGANTKLVTVAEDYTGKSFPVAVFNVGQEDGSLASSWTTAPNIIFNTLGNGAQIFEAKACEKGIWVATNRSTGGNTSDATSLRFYTWDGTCTWSSHEHTNIINGSLGGGIAITPDEKQIVMKIHDNNIAVFDITWNEDTPTLTTNATFNCGYAAVSAINLDYAGNIVTVAGTNFGSTNDQRMSLVVYSNPTNDNTCEVPAKKSSVVTKVAATATLYTVVTNVNDVAMGEVTGNAGTYEEGATATLTATPAKGYEFVNWTKGEEIVSTENPYSFVVTADVTLVANFAAVEPEPVVMTGIVKRALQNGENVIVLTHEADGTPHIYNIVKGEAYEVSQEGVVARDLENKGDYLSISDIAVTDDGKLVACNYIRCQYSDAQVETDYKKGTSRYYIWNNINAAPTLWFTSQEAGGCNIADVGQSFAVKGASTNAKVMTSAAHNNNRAVRINLHTIINGAEDVNAFYRFGDYQKSAYYTEEKQGAKFQLSRTTLDGIWAMDGELVNPSAFSIPTTGVKGENYSGTELPSEIELGKKYNGASYVTCLLKELMVAPYADAEGKLAGVKVIDITAGFATAKVIKEANLDAPVAATAAATAVAVAENVLTVTLVADAEVHTLTIELDTKAETHTITATANIEERGYIEGLENEGVYEAGDEVTLRAVANDGYEFVDWSNGSKDNPLTFVVRKDETLVANFRPALASTITLNALPVQDYSTSIVGTIKRAIQNGENTIVLTHEADGTPHIYNVAHATKTVTEISQEGVVARDPDNVGDYLSISDIALTDDGKLVACNYIRCQNTDAQVDAGYKRGTNRFYIWDELTGGAKEWFTEQFAGNSYRADAGYTMALKGSSTDCNILVTVRHYNAAGAGGSDGSVRMHYFTIAGGEKTSRIYLGWTIEPTAPYYTHTIGENMLLSSSPIATMNFIMDANLTVPSEFQVIGDAKDVTILGRMAADSVSAKYNGASCLPNYNEHHLLLTPYANAEGNLAGVKVLDIVDGIATATKLTTDTDLATAENATAAAATAVVDAEGKLTIHLFADAKVYTFTQKEQTDGPATAIDNTVVAPQVQKIVRDGQVLIIRDGKTFNMMGQEVK